MKITQTEVLKRINGLPRETQQAMVCALVGHTRIVRSCFGQITCGRCDAIVGDTLAGCYDMTGKVIIDHNCPTCVEVYKTLRWKDKLLAPDPFKEVEG